MKMKSKNLGNIITLIIGVSMLVLGWIYHEKFSFIFVGLGIALIGISIELYLKNKKDTTTDKGISRNMIDSYDERTILVNAKSGETINYIMGFLTVIALTVAKLLEISLVGMMIILSLMIVRLIITPIIKNYYENRI
jgi:membrane protein insertase Oxa1/YidC/SpoIIIJ